MNISQFINNLRYLKGVKYRHQGRNKFGLDCVGLPILAARNAGIDLEDFTGYSTRPDPNTFFKYMLKNCERVETFEELKVGDVICVKYDSNPQHVAIVTQLSPTMIIHSSMPHRGVVEHVLDETTKKSIFCIFRIKRFYE